VGRTGSGKSVAAGFHLLQQPWQEMPWLIYNFKGDELIEDIGRHPDVRHIKPSEFVDGPGLYVVNPLPGQEEEVEEQLWKVWGHRWIGVWIDEGYMVTGSNAYRALLTQGRSLRIPVISLSQRPVWMDKFSFTEASYYQVFDLNNMADRKKMMEYIPHNISGELPDFYSFYHDVARKTTELLQPVPPPNEIVKRFHAKLDALRPRRRVHVI
jgi:hypothetical protein